MIIVGAIVIIFLIWIFLGANKNTEKTYDIEQEEISESIPVIREQESIITEKTIHEKRVEDKLNEICDILNFFKTLIIIQLLITGAGIIWAITKIGIGIDLITKIFR